MKPATSFRGPNGPPFLGPLSTLGLGATHSAKMPNRLSATTTNAGYSQFGSAPYGFLTRYLPQCDGEGFGERQVAFI
jgi:hypothetical protein